MSTSPVIERVVHALQWAANGTGERESVQVRETTGKRRVVVMESREGLEVRVTGDSATFTAQGRDRCAVQVYKAGTLLAEAHGVPATGTGRVARAVLQSLQANGSGISPEEVIEAFDTELRARRGPGFDPLVRIAEEHEGPVWIELVDYAYRKGFDLDGHAGKGRRFLWVAFDEYASRVRAELGLSPVAV